MEQRKEFVRRITRSQLEVSRRGKLGCFPGDLTQERVQKGEKKVVESRIVLPRALTA